jgi:formyltetrahydrofolate deformylase
MAEQLNAEPIKSYIVLVECEDTKGLIHGITGVILEHSLNIEQQDEFVHKESNRFFMRSDVSGEVDVSNLYVALSAVLPKDSTLRVVERQKKNIAVLATMEPHCLGDLLIRHAYGELQANIKFVLSNHKALGALVDKFDLPFHYVSHKGLSREEHEQKLIEIIETEDLDYIVLAKYMRIFTPEFVNRFPNRLINIHHSFLPAFVGANPYLQAFRRGVKIIGATAHFVTSCLDEGPIIAQNVAQVDHREGVKDIIQKGRDVEKIVLAGALRLVFQDKVFVHQNRTIVFD